MLSHQVDVVVIVYYGSLFCHQISIHEYCSDFYIFERICENSIAICQNQIIFLKDYDA